MTPEEKLIACVDKAGVGHEPDKLTCLEDYATLHGAASSRQPYQPYQPYQPDPLSYLLFPATLVAAYAMAAILDIARAEPRADGSPPKPKTPTTKGPDK